MPFAYPNRFQIKAQIVSRVAAGERLAAICAEPAVPGVSNVHLWRKADPAFAADLAQAYVRGDWRRRLAFDAVKANAFLERMAGGEPVASVLRDPAMPSRWTYTYWIRMEASFAERVWQLKGVAAEVARARALRRYRAFDWALADRILLGVARGRLLGAVLASDGSLPGRSVVYRWRLQKPEWDGAMRTAVRAGRRARGHPRALRTPALTEAIVNGILLGGSLHSLGREPGMPKARTLYSWIAKDEAFAAEVARACENRQDWYIDQMTEIIDAAGPVSLAELQRRISPLARQHGRLQNRPGRKWLRPSS